MSEPPVSTEVPFDEQVRRAYKVARDHVTPTFDAAEDHLKVPRGTLTGVLDDIGFIVVMKMATTIEPILNDALEAEIIRLRRGQEDLAKAQLLADCIRSEAKFGKKARLARSLQLIEEKHLDFIESLMAVRHHYAHHVSNLPLTIGEAAIKTRVRNNDKQFFNKLFGNAAGQLDTASEEELDVVTRLGLLWGFAGFLASTLKVIRPPPPPKIYGGAIASGPIGSGPIAG